MRSQDSGIVPGAPVEQTTPTKRSRTFEEIRQENRRKLRQRAYEEEPSAGEGDTWRRGMQRGCGMQWVRGRYAEGVWSHAMGTWLHSYSLTKSYQFV